MNLIFLGAPGAGKGTQSTVVAEKMNIPHISTGDIFRYNIKNQTELGKKANEYISKGELVPDKLTISIVADRLMQDDCKNGFALDGFPRTIPQAEALEKFLADHGKKIDNALNIQVDENILVERLSGRRFCPKCSGTFHMVENKLTEEICPDCGAELKQRDDDKEEVILQRLQEYHKNTEPLIDFYRSRNVLTDVPPIIGMEKAIAATLKILGIEQ